MIALVAGEVAVRRPDHVVIETAGGVGYRLAVSAETLRQVPGVGRAVSLHTHLVVRDDALALYGFATEEERDLFLALIGVQSVGPKVALACSAVAPAPSWSPRSWPATSPACSCAGHRQAHGRADRRRAARKVGAQRPRRADPVTRGDDPATSPATAARARLPARRGQVLLAAAEGETAEELLASALRGEAMT